MPQIAVDETTYATVRAAAIARGTSNEAVVLDLLHKSLPPFDPGMLAGHEVDGLLIAYYEGRFCGVGIWIEKTDSDVGGQKITRIPLVEWCAWFAPIIAGRSIRWGRQ